MSEEKTHFSPMQYTYSDRAMDEDVSPWDIDVPSSRDTIDLLGYWRQIQKDKENDRTESPEWTALEMSYLAHLKWRFDYPRKISSQQIAFTWIMTLLVFLLVIAGLLFSFLQLNYALKMGDISHLENELAIQTAGNLSFRSSVIGTAVLVVSLVFYYLYLQYIFSAKPNKPLHLSLYSTDAPTLFGKRKHLPRRRRTVKKLDE